MKNLLESVFLTVNLSSIVNAEKQPATTDVKKPDSSDDKQTGTGDGTQPAGGKVTDWKKEYDRRYAENERLPQDARISILELEESFWRDYFTANWKAEYVEYLLKLGEQLRKDIKILGFTFQTNPLIDFLTGNYVLDKLLKPGLLNKNTFKVVHNMLANNIVAEDDFQEAKAQRYNLLYCRDLYTKPLADMDAYLRLQKTILGTSGTVTEELKLLNRQIFLQVDGVEGETDDEKARMQFAAKPTAVPLMIEDDAKLLPKAFVELLAKKAKTTNNTVDDTEDDEDDEASAKKAPSASGSVALESFVGALRSPADARAVLQYIVMQTGNESASKALDRDELSGVTMDALTASTRKLAPALKKLSITTQNAQELVQLVLTSKAIRNK